MCPVVFVWRISARRLDINRSFVFAITFIICYCGYFYNDLGRLSDDDADTGLFLRFFLSQNRE
jgi:hypothetical protein